MIFYQLRGCCHFRHYGRSWNSTSSRSRISPQAPSGLQRFSASSIARKWGGYMLRAHIAWSHFDGICLWCKVGGICFIVEKYTVCQNGEADL
jgi:hypothetical protein